MVGCHWPQRPWVMNMSCGRMMRSSNENIFRVTGPLCGEFTGHRRIPPTKASDAELWCFLLTCARMNGWVNNRGAGDLRRHRADYDVRVMAHPETITSDGGMIRGRSQPESSINTLRRRQYYRHFADDIFKRILLNWNYHSNSPDVQLSTYIPALVSIMAWRQAISWTTCDLFTDAYMRPSASMGFNPLRPGARVCVNELGHRWFPVRLPLTSTNMGGADVLSYSKKPRAMIVDLMRSNSGQVLGWPDPLRPGRDISMAYCKTVVSPMEILQCICACINLVTIGWGNGLSYDRCQASTST